MNFFARHTLTELYMLEHSDGVYLHGSTMLNTSHSEFEIWARGHGIHSILTIKFNF
jgi:hypothetical protein